MQAARCQTCGKQFNFLNWRNQCPQERGGCGKAFCSTCINFPCCSEEQLKKDRSRARFHQFCFECYKKLNLLDFSRNYDVIGSEEGLNIMLVHGGGGNRLMFRPLAQALAKRGYRCVLPDLPGHGSRVKQLLSLSSAFEVIKQTALGVCKQFKGMKPVYLGGSLGGYIGMQVPGREGGADLFSAMVICMAGQNVGKNRSFKAGAGMKLIGLSAKLMRNKTLCELMLRQITGNKNIPMQVADGVMRTGMLFQANPAMCDILNNSDPLTSLAKAACPFLFVNGSEDQRDSQQLWAKACKGTLRVYEGGDHFFSHDSRFAHCLEEHVHGFIEEKVVHLSAGIQY